MLSWLDPPVPNRAVLRYEDLVRAPDVAVPQILVELGLPLPAVTGVAVPSFAELHALDPQFFRRGHAGTHRDEMTEDLHRRFWARPDNTAAMTLLGYHRHAHPPGTP